MDKPDLLKAIQALHPTEQVEYIQMLAKAELNRQVEESIKGMLHKKPVMHLLSVIEYKESEQVVQKSKK